MTDGAKVRILVAKPGLDGHDVGAKVIVRALMEAGFDVTYTGLRQSPEEIVGAIREQKPDVLGLSILSGSHLPICRKMAKLLSKAGLDDILWIERQGLEDLGRDERGLGEGATDGYGLVSVVLAFAGVGLGEVFFEFLEDVFFFLEFGDQAVFALLAALELGCEGLGGFGWGGGLGWHAVRRRGVRGCAVCRRAVRRGAVRRRVLHRRIGLGGLSVFLHGRRRASVSVAGEACWGARATVCLGRGVLEALP